MRLINIIYIADAGILTQPLSNSSLRHDQPEAVDETAPQSQLFSVDDSMESSYDEELPEVDETAASEQLGRVNERLPAPKTRKKKASILRKEARNSGQGYSTVKGKYIAEKIFKFQHCNCRYNCKDLTAEERRSIFDSFWGTQNWQSQENIISNLVKITSPKRRTTADSSSKSQSRTFFLNEKRVCKLVFLVTLGISNKRLHYCMSKKSKLGICSPDRRGRITPNKTPEFKIKAIKNFLDSLDKFKSHYSKSDKVYFDKDLTMDILYRQYVVKENEEGRQTVSRPIFNKHFKAYNIGIYVPRTDTCQTCDSFKMKESCASEEEKELLKTQHSDHLTRAELARKRLSQATEDVKTQSDLLVFTFDMQKNQPLPRLDTSVAFFKRQLWVYNLGINDRKTNQGYMAMWTECEGRKGAREICSSLLQFINTIDTDKIKHVKTFSDACGGQNRNKAIVCFFMYLCNVKHIETWEHTYLESGHSYLPNDRDFSVIEKKCKGKLVYGREDWFDLVSKAMVKQPFNVIDMNGKFINVDQLVSNRAFCNSNTTDTEKFNFLKLKSFAVSKNSDKISYRTTNSGQTHYFTYPLREQNITSLAVTSIENKISREKYADLMSLLPYILPCKADYYRNLPHD